MDANYRNTLIAECLDGARKHIAEFNAGGGHISFSGIRGAVTSWGVGLSQEDRDVIANTLGKELVASGFDLRERALSNKPWTPKS
jgi:hypothetical protein